MCFIVIRVKNYLLKTVFESLKKKKKKKNAYNKHRPKREKQVIDHNTGDKN